MIVVPGGLGSIWVGKRIANITQAIQVPHNGYLEMLWEIGSIGTLLFVLVVIAAYITSVKLIQANIDNFSRRMVSVSIGICAGILLTHGLINAFTQMYQTAVYFWLFLGILSGLADRKSDLDATVKSARPETGAKLDESP